MNKIGMIGLGAMGHSIAQNILNKGHEMVLYDIRPEAYADLLGQGAEGAESLQELGQKADIVLMMVNTYPQCCSVMDSLLQTLRGGVIINLGTIAMDEAQALEKLALAADCQMVDCPVSGGTAGAKAGTLTLMAACSDEVFDRCKPVLECFATNAKHVGTQVGQGQAIKAINQLLVGVHMCATAEAFTLARKCGLDLQTMYDTICTSAGRSEIFRNRGQYLIDRNFDTRSTLQIQLKDTGIACKTADAVGAHTPLANLAKEMFKLAVQKYPPTDDSLEVVRLYEEISNVEL
jgi:3-hydroxyisobutyrate dehydrogenase